MKAWHLRNYMFELAHQARAAHLAVSDLDAALGELSAGPTPESGEEQQARAFASVQALLAAASMMSNLLWGQKKAPRASRERGETSDASSESIACPCSRIERFGTTSSTLTSGWISSLRQARPWLLTSSSARGTR